jgi:hypothetical protein
MTKIRKPSPDKRVSVYIADAQIYDSLRDEIKFLWFRRYGETLTHTDIITKALICLKDVLLNQLSDKINKKEKMSDFFCRTRQ